jgi:HEAT repeat protein
MMRPLFLFAIVAVVLAVVIYEGLLAHRKMVVNDSLKLVFSSGTNQGTVLRNLQKMGAQAVPAEVQALSQTGEIGSAAELALLNNRSATNVLPKIVSLLEDKNPEVRLRAAGLISDKVANGIRLSDSTFVPALARALNDTNDYVREEMALALSELGPAAELAVPALAKALNDNSARVRIMAAMALLKIDASQKAAVVPVFKDVIANGNARDRHWAAVYLHQIQPENAEIIPVFVGSLTNQESGIRSSAAYSLLSYGSNAKIAIPALQKALGDADADVRQAARDALQNIDPAALKNKNAQADAPAP